MHQDLFEAGSAWAAFRHLVQRQEIPKKTVLLQEGEVANNVYYIQSGCLRIYFNHDGRDITFQFFFEGDGVSSIESFRYNQPSLFALESIEPCVLYCIAKEDFQTILDSSPDIRQELERHTMQRLLHYQKLFLSRIKDNPAQRYRDLLESHPEILQRVPQHYIASYLGITSVSLSRIRNRR